MKPTLPLQFSTIAAIIAEELGVSSRLIEPGTTLTGIACDSLHVMSVAGRCEEDFAIEIGDDIVEGWRTPLDIARSVALLLAVKGAVLECGEVVL